MFRILNIVSKEIDEENIRNRRGKGFEIDSSIQFSISDPVSVKLDLGTGTRAHTIHRIRIQYILVAIKDSCNIRRISTYYVSLKCIYIFINKEAFYFINTR